jgi:hypothetical protein
LAAAAIRAVEIALPDLFEPFFVSAVEQHLEDAQLKN